MKRLILTLLFIFCISFCNMILAQDYHVCEASSEVCTIAKGVKTPVTKKQVINEKERLEIPAYGYIILLDSINRKSYKIDTPCRDMLKNIISTDKATVEELTLKYFRYIWKKMCGNYDMAVTSTVGQRVTAAFRDIDSLFVDSTARGTALTDTVCRPIACKRDSTVQQDTVQVKIHRKAECEKDECKKDE
ncbi:MAG: hypothetical protein K2J00_08510 [Bacteroidaceae bacterium]|nr:hypothetical protein [Bacteroidaceae bacterium]